MKGQWVSIVEPPCQCDDKPKGGTTRPLQGNGSIWQCACGKQWRVTWKFDRDGWYGDWDLVQTVPDTSAF